MIISPNASDTSTSIYQCNGGVTRFRSIPAENVNDSTTHISFGKAEDGSPATQVYHLQDPEDDNHAANKRYVDQRVATARVGTQTNPGLQQGELYWNTTNKVLYIGT